MIWDFKEQEKIHNEIEKQMLGKQTFAGPSLTMGYREDFDQTASARFLPVTHQFIVNHSYL